ncbi:nicotinate-nucleotide--dimethylbenzimidazole phosphoribosyltransferase [Streptomyces sp. NPDC051211]|uniref:nicotinate-nucleotide--dimethylbenzimidazole phosphoribosyltransferase n=1 Tax=Streptomyces sp. NPDC051211 TaxID=3154643 RepID=UPI00344EA40B
MTDTGQVPGEGLPDNAGMAEQQGIPAPIPAPGAYAFQDLADNPGEDEDELLLMPSGQGSWSDPQVVPPVPTYPVEGYAETPYAETPYAEAPYAEAPYAEPGYAEAPYTDGAHEAGGRDSGAIDLGGLHLASPAPAAPAAQAAPPARRPLHMGPPVPDASGGVVRSLADRGPAPVPAPVPAAQPGPEYLDIPVQTGVPWPAAPVAEPAETVVQAPEQPMAEPLPAAAAAEPAPAPSPASPERSADPAAVPEPAVVPVAEPAVAPAAEAAVAPAVAPQPAAEAGGLLSSAVPAGQAPVEPAAEAGGLLPADIAPEAVPAAPAPVAVEPAAEPQPPLTAEAESPLSPAAPAEIAEPAEPAPAFDLTGDTGDQAAADAADAAGAVPEPAAAAVVVETAPQPAAEAPAPDSAPEPQAVAEPAGLPDQAVPDAPDAPDAPAVDPAAEPAAVAAPQPVLAEPALVEPVLVEPAPAEAVAVTGPLDPDPYLTAPAEAGQAEQPVPAEQPAPAEPAQQPVPAAAAEYAEPAENAEPVAEVPQHSPGEAAPGYADAEREAVLRVMRERRDIRNGFRTDPIPHEVLLRVLEAAHTAPSVGHSQPWDFVVIRSAETRRTMHELAQRQREAYAKSLPKGRAKQFKEMKIEAILDTPVNIVVTADPTRGGRHTLGRHTQPQMAPYSSALAVENLWLAARAEGLGVGWVSFFDEREMVRALGLPEHLEVVAYLCVGYVDEFPDEPELMQAGWSKRRPLSWVVHEETYGRRALPGEEPHDLLAETVGSIRPLDAKALGEAWERQKRMTKPAGALGMLEIISAQLSGLSRVSPPPIPEPAAVAIFAGDHGVHAQGVTPWPQEVTSQMVANFLGGGAVCNAFANQVGAEVCVIDVGVAGDLPATPGLLPRKVRPGTADMVTGPAMSREEAVAAIEVGIETARDLVAAGNKGLLTGEMGIANTTVSAALISVFTGVDPAEVTGRGTGINDETHARKVDVVRRALELHRPDPADPIGVLAAIGGLEHAAMVGLILGAASLRTPVILDGVSAGAAALVARAIAPESLSACIAGHRSAEPGHVAALNKLGLRPLVDLDLRLGEGTGALLALPLVQSAARAMHEVATFDSAGVTEK